MGEGAGPGLHLGGGHLSGAADVPRLHLPWAQKEEGNADAEGRADGGRKTVRGSKAREPRVIVWMTEIKHTSLDHGETVLTFLES